MRTRRFLCATALIAFCGLPLGARSKEGDEPGGGGGGDDVTKQINEAVEKATAPLKANRDEILTEKRKLKESLDAVQHQIESLGGADGLKALIDMRERLSKDEMGKLIAEGKHDEWFDRRAASLRKDLESKIAAATKDAEEAKKERDAALGAYSRKEIETTVMQAATKAGITDSAIDDVLLRANNTFSFDPALGIVMKDADGGLVYGKDGKTPKNVTEWLDDMKDKARHWFPGSRGAGAEGGIGGPGIPLDDARVSQMPMSEYREYRKKQGMEAGWAGRLKL